MIRIDAVWLATVPMDMRAGTDTALARVVQVFGSAHPHTAYLFAIGTPQLVIAPATINRVAMAIRHQSGPAEAGYWGCVSISDTRTGESRAVVVTDPPPKPA